MNFFKSEVIGVCTNDIQMGKLANVIGCKIGSLPTSCLSLPLCLGATSKALWDPVIERVSSKLAIWKASYLSKRGKITLIKSVLSDLPIYFMSIFKCPGSVSQHIEKLQRNFLWRGVAERNRIHLLNWSKICKSKKEGLGIRPLKLVNEALFWKMVLVAQR